MKGELPRVILETTKGVVELELFEDSAPNTVSAFLQLVRDGAYDGKCFSTVVSGLFARTEPVTADTELVKEAAGAEARKHFRGSVVWVQSDSAGQVNGQVQMNRPMNGQFFVMFTPAPQLDGKYTVFGRVTKGMEVISSFQRVDSRNLEDSHTAVQADRILSARVLNRSRY